MNMRVFIFSFVCIIALTKLNFGQVTDLVLNTEASQKEIKKMIVYGSDTCHYCIDTKAYLKERKIDFIYYDVDVNLLKQREMLIKIQNAGLSLDNLSLPVIDLSGKLLMNSNDFEGFLKKLEPVKN